MNNQFIRIDFAGSRDIFKVKLKEIMQTPQFCGDKAIDFGRIDKLTEELEENISYVFDYPYVDRHYRDTFYFFHSAKHEEFYRNCIRIHLFTDFFITKSDDLINLTDADKEKYRGFFIVRPLPRFPLGRSMISPSAFQKRRILCCLMKSRVSLLGHRLEVFGFPHIAQDTETHTCAESSLWSLLEYLGNRYRQYLPLMPSDIIHKLSSVSSHRSLPSIGLNVNEISKFLHDNGCECEIDKASYIDASGNIKIVTSSLFYLKIYIESGIPVYITLIDNKGPGHTALVIGHEDRYDHIALPPAKVWQDISDYDKKMVVIDDNQPPYQIGALETLIPYNTDYRISYYFVPLPKHTNLDAQQAYSLSRDVFDDPNVGLKTFGEQWLTRLFLTGSHSFKRFILERSGIDEVLKKHFALRAFPKFIWVCEIYKIDEFQQDEKKCSGLLIMDATGSNSITSVLWYNVGDKQIIHNSLGWTSKKPIKIFKIFSYQHNLKGDWSGWKLQRLSKKQ